MRYLIDTDWAIDHMHHVAGVSHRLEELAPRGIGISVVSLAEIYEGVFYSTDPDGNERALRLLLAEFDVLPLDDEACRIFARERGHLRTAGTPIGDMDLLIGATAIRHGLTILTNNRRHFSRLRGLDIISV